MSKVKLMILILGVVVLMGGAGVGVYLVTQPTGFWLRAEDRVAPQGVRVAEVTGEMARIRWSTEEAVQALVYYGLNPSSLTLVQSEATPAKEHLVEMAGLLSESTYYFVINVGKERFTDGGQPWQFKTLAKGKVTPTVTVTPTPIGEVSLEGLKAAMGKDSPVFDLNGDGIVSLVDVKIFREREATKSGRGATVTVTPTVIPTVTPGG